LSTYLWWAGNQVAGRAFGWVAANPAEASLITAALANPATRKFTMDVLKIVVKENIRSWANISRGIGSSLINRSTWAARANAAVRTALSSARTFIAANPVTILATLAVAGTVAQTSGTYGQDAGIRGSPGSVPPSFHLRPDGKIGLTAEDVIKHEIWKPLAFFSNNPIVRAIGNRV
jgi:hypothetical protein